MKKESPDELAVAVGVECTADATDRYEEVVRDVLIRSRVKPLNVQLSAIGLNGIYLRGWVNCIRYSETNYVFYIKLHFAYVDPEYYEYGVKDADGIEEALESRAEVAITDYLKANYDLGDLPANNAEGERLSMPV